VKSVALGNGYASNHAARFGWTRDRSLRNRSNDTNTAKWIPPFVNTALMSAATSEAVYQPGWRRRRLVSALREAGFAVERPSRASTIGDSWVTHSCQSDRAGIVGNMPKPSARGTLRLDVTMTTTEKLETMSRAGMAGIVQALVGLAIVAGLWGVVVTSETRDRVMLLLLVTAGVVVQVGLIAYYRLPVAR
jgi:hypothetical protein